MPAWRRGGVVIPQLYALAGAVVVAAALGTGGAWYARGVVADRDLAQLGRQHAQAVAQAAGTAREAEAQARLEEQRRAAALQEIADEADAARARATADADRARRAADSLRDAARAAAARCSAPADDPTAAEPGASAASPGLVLADVLGRADDRAGELAAALDASRAAGLACERAYDALTR